MMGAWPSLRFLSSLAFPGSHTFTLCDPSLASASLVFPFPLRNSESGDFCLSLTHAPPGAQNRV